MGRFAAVRGALVGEIGAAIVARLGVGGAAVLRRDIARPIAADAIPVDPRLPLSQSLHVHGHRVIS